MNGSVAKRYAKALFEEAKEQFVDGQVYAHLGTLHSNMKATPDLQMALINPRVSPEKKYSLLLLASGLDPEATTLYTRFLQLLLKNHRENKLRLIIFVYRDLYREYHQIDRVVFETAVPVERAMVEKLIQSIKRHTGREVECETKVKPSLIGGFRLRIGDHRYDYSYQYKLEKIRECLGATLPRT
ncbi:MAG: F0F1 ATP synthase subunit delta [Bacteroidaceae bacterium]|nr:F0F1 ATP synthase subunit delta [Bacteroidaceae bacterium]